MWHRLCSLSLDAVLLNQKIANPGKPHHPISPMPHRDDTASVPQPATCLHSSARNRREKTPEGLPILSLFKPKKMFTPELANWPGDARRSDSGAPSRTLSRPQNQTAGIRNEKSKAQPLPVAFSQLRSGTVRYGQFFCFSDSKPVALVDRGPWTPRPRRNIPQTLCGTSADPPQLSPISPRHSAT
jgi:hypothetical protein